MFKVNGWWRGFRLLGSVMGMCILMSRCLLRIVGRMVCCFEFKFKFEGEFWLIVWFGGGGEYDIKSIGCILSF